VVKRGIITLWIVLSWVLPNMASAREYLEINNPNFRPYPLAVPDVKDLGATGDKLTKEATEILRSDLEIAGTFKLLDPRSFLGDPSRESVQVDSINFGNWINVGAEGLVKVGLQKSGAELTLDGHLYDVASGKELLNKRYQGPEAALRQMVHRFTDAIVMHYTGTRSIFFTKIVFTKKMAGSNNKVICVMDFDGANEFCPIDNNSINLLPAWSADGNAIYYSSYLHGGPHLYRYDLAEGKSKTISREPGLNIGVSAAPNGKLIAATLSRDDNAEIYTMDPGGGNLRRLTRDWAIDSSASFSPDSQKITFVSERAGTPQIYMMNVDGSNVKRLTFQGNYNQTPHWSPRGDWILFNARDERLVYDIFKIKPDTGVIVRLTQDQGNNEHPNFSPDGNHVVISSTRSGGSKLYLMNADGTNQRLVSRGKGEYTTPDWSTWLNIKE
jgi:TolB protein